ncbi:MAG: hypothetical protein A2X01_16925 [Bacteroidetes bacterium GWF2_35_48]|nr:MAG: hypothetical protein A2X01_16925 [Bacteroidetes bacterium GWF2_35_48]
MPIDSVLKQELKKWIIAFSNNLVLFLLTFLIVFLAHNAVLSFVGFFTGVKVNLNNFTIPFNSPNSSLSSIIFVFLSGPVTLLSLGIIFYSLFRVAKRKKGILKILFLWGYINSFNMLLAYMVIGLLTDSGFGEITWRLHFSDMMKIMLIFVSMLLIVLIGNSNSKYFYTTTFSRSFTETRRKRVMFIIIALLLPVVIGFGIFTLINYSSNSFYQQAVLISLILLIIPSFRDKQAYTHIRLMRDPTKPGIVWGWVFVLAALVCVYRFLLAFGIVF